VRVEFGLLSAAEGKNRVAKTQLRDARARLVKILGVDHPQVASTENNLAVVCLQLGDVDEANALLDHAVQTLRRASDASERELGTYLTNMAEVRRRQGKLQDSEAHLKEALGLLERVLTPDSPDLLWVLEQYAAVVKARRSPGVKAVLWRINALRSQSTR
jgi:Flp pilus assembly protein TadD